MASFVLGAVGGYYGGPIGAAFGSAVGSIIDSYLFAPDPVAQQGPRLADLAQNADSPGGPVPVLWGPSNRTGVITAWTSGLKETEHEEEVKGGKLDGPTVATVTTYTYAADVFLVVGQTGHGGAFTGIKRIWAGPRLFYDSTASPPFADSRAADVRINLGTLTQGADAMIEAAEGAGNVNAERTLCTIAIQDMQLADWNNVIPPFFVEADAGPADLQSLVGDLCTLGNIPVAEQSVRNLEKTQIEGFALKRLTSPRGALDVLSPVYQFDMADSGNKVTFRRRRRSADVLIFEEDFGAREPDASPIPTEPRTLESNRILPREIHLRYLDPDRDLQPNVVRSDKLATDDKSTRIVDFPGVLTTDQARQALDDILSEVWQAKAEIELSLPAKYLFLDAGDIVRIRRQASVFWPRFLITKWTLGANWRINVTLRPLSRQWARRVAPASAGSVASQVIPNESTSSPLLFDLPFLSATNADRNSYLAGIRDVGDGNEWPGANLYQATNGVDYFLQGYFPTTAISGTCDTILGDGPTFWPDRTSTLDITLDNGTLTSITEAEFLDTQTDNFAIVGSELINFRDVTLIGLNQYRLSGGLKRGRRGTGWATSGHIASERFVLITAGTLKRLGMSLSLLSQLLDYKAVTIGKTVAGAASSTFQVGGIWATPFAGEDAAGERDGSNNLTVTWSRGDRFYFGEWVGAAPMSEATESYDVDFLDGATVVRTKTVSTPSVSYTAAEQTTDGLTPGDPVDCRIYQNSAIVGRGYVLTATV